MKYLHILACVVSLSFECMAANPLSRTVPTNLSVLPSCYISKQNSSEVVRNHIEYLEKTHEELAEQKNSDSNETSHSYVSMKKCIACVVSLFNTSLSPHESLNDILKENKDYTSSAAVDERLTDEAVANAINTIEKYRESNGNNKNFLGSFQTHCLCLALRNGILEKEAIKTFVSDKITSIQNKIDSKFNFKLDEKIQETVAGACADAIQYFCLDKLIMDLTHSVYGNNLKVKKFDKQLNKKEATAMDLLLSNDVLRQKVIEKKYKKVDAGKIVINEGQNDLINCSCSAILQSLPYSTCAYDDNLIQFPEKSIFGNSDATIETILKDVLGENIGVTEKDFSKETAPLPTPFHNELSKNLKDCDMVIYSCKNANSKVTRTYQSNAIGQFKLNNVAMVKKANHKTLSFIGFSNDFNNVNLFEKFGGEISYQASPGQTQSDETANIWLKNGAIVKDDDKITEHPDNYLFILYNKK